MKGILPIHYYAAISVLLVRQYTIFVLFYNREGIGASNKKRQYEQTVFTDRHETEKWYLYQEIYPILLSLAITSAENLTRNTVLS